MWRARGNQRGPGEEKNHITTRDCQVTGPLVKAGMWGERALGGWSEAEGGRYPRTGEPWGQQGTGHRSRTARGGNQTGEVSHVSRQKLLWYASMGGMRRQVVAAGGRERRPGGHPLHDREIEEGGEAGAKRDGSVAKG